jgi:hypothetical protein
MVGACRRYIDVNPVSTFTGYLIPAAVPCALTTLTLADIVIEHHSPPTEEPGALITLPELLDDPKYKAFFLKVPKTLKPLPGQKPWRVFIQQRTDGPWAKKEYERYADAFATIRKYLKDGRLHDGAIQSRGIAFGPPERTVKVVKNGRPVYHLRAGKKVLGSDGLPIQVTRTILWRPKLEASEETHTWCTYCRRPTVFRWFLSHHAVKASGLHGMVDVSDRRCTICGAREDYVRTTTATARPPHFDPRSYLNAKPSRTRR